jgi:hypothetical protein
VREHPIPLGYDMEESRRSFQRTIEAILWKMGGRV